MQYGLPLVLLFLVLGGCGLGATGTAGATGARSEVQEAAQAKQVEERVPQQLQAAQDQVAKQRSDAEAQNQ